MKLDHIALVVKDLERATRLFQLLGYEAQEPRRLAGILGILMTRGESSIALLFPASRQADLQPFLATRGPGMQHIAFEVASLEEAEELLGGVLEWDREPFVHPGVRVRWSKPEPATGLVVELIERRDAGGKG